VKVKLVSKIQAAQTKFLRNAMECTRLGKLKNEDTQNEINITQ
jgi:hypothetical protein